ncbi:transcriptional regulator LysR [Profundibacterium mesophilum KAUST100406-0324]|uniref:Transcriptional regulator LysR n=1 Tax=Profundibacterium mesophilum KAUST100406-0324 TaxID=1037889 RepID=A0A921NXG1_9RHOB|nr:transcriptional regulator LysR [Profundibacterium mesophilum KAUST100406-0324]
MLPADAADTPVPLAELQSRGFIAHPDGHGYAADPLKVNVPGDYPGADRLRIRGTVNQIGQIPRPWPAGSAIPFCRAVAWRPMPGRRTFP